MEIRPRSPLVIAIVSAAFVLAVLYVIYRLVDPLPPRHLTIAAGMTTLKSNTHGYLRAMALRWRSATPLAQSLVRSKSALI